MSTRSPLDQVTVRSMRPADLRSVMVIERRSFTAPWEEATFRGLMRRPSAALLVAERESEVVGYSVTWFAADEAELGDIAVLPELRGLGLGRLLLDESIALARERGTRSLYLEVREANRVARELYRSAGFEVAGVRKQYYKEPVEDAIVMRLDLDRKVR
ncbi:MAG: ribosomal protein S18-alanine N-acetyltransferase [marine benthic group bacterium]|nr:ribosomal protein S18-alanine N-acetyltransferase [Candidatus Benthicola marisminoris]